jgi:hypothetical protein
MPERRTRTGVEIARVGRYDLSTGTHEFTKAQLAAAVAHAADRAPRIGIGHIDPRFNPATHDGDPAFGRVVNLRLDQDGNVLVGDFDGMAAWLDENLDVAYPGRSIEARVKGDDMQITAVKLLGTTPPGISTLKDLASAIAASVADGETSEADAHVAIRVLLASPEATAAPEPESRPTPPKREESTVDPKTLREQLGLAEDASDADVTAKLTELAARPDETAVKEQVAAAAEQAKTEAIAAAASTDDGETVKLDKATFTELKASAEKGAEAHRKIAAAERDTFIAAAVGDGKFPPSRVEHYTKRYDSDPDGTRAEIDALEKGVIPVKEIGASTTTDDTELVTTGLFPQLQEA